MKLVKDPPYKIKDHKAGPRLQENCPLPAPVEFQKATNLQHKSGTWRMQNRPPNVSHSLPTAASESEQNLIPDPAPRVLLYTWI